MTVRRSSIRSRLANALLLWSLLWGLSVGAAVWLAAIHEVDELLNDSLQASADLIAGLQPGHLAAAPDPATPPGQATRPSTADGERFAWQLVAADGRLLARSALAPPQPWHRSASLGFSDLPDWHVYGRALGEEGQLLYAAQSQDERFEARSEVALGAVLAALAIGLIGHVWLRSRVRHELAPLQTLSQAVLDWDVDKAEHGQPLRLPQARREEIDVVAHALESLTDRLSLRLANERAFSAHAAHALRTPLAGIDAQLAVALRDSPLALRERLQRARDAATRLQAVVAALLGLFRSGSEPQIERIDLPRLVSRLPTPGLQVHVDDVALDADADLLAAALANLLDNAHRQGASEAWLTQPSRQVLRLHDNGRGLPAEQRLALQQRLDTQDFDSHGGLGLMLADRVARAHSGRLRLLPAAEGFCVELRLLDMPASLTAPEPG
jgi:signal transduction histidine kinase